MSDAPGTARRPRRRGRFRKTLSDEQLLDVVAGVARVASPEAAGLVSQRAWDAARASAVAAGLTGALAAPTARAIVMRFSHLQGEIAWQRLLEIALGGAESRRSLIQVEREEPRSYLGPDHLYYALRLAARELPADAYLGPDAYNRIRAQLIRRERPAAGLASLKELLPTSAQIMRIAASEAEGSRPGEGPGQPAAASSWEQALVTADLPCARPRSAAAPPERPGSLPAEKAVVAFLEANGGWPSADQFEAFTRRLSIVVSSTERRRRGWQAVIDKAAAAQRSQGRWHPPSASRIGGGVDGVLLPEAPIPGALTREQFRHSYPRRVSREDCLRAMRAFLKLVAETPGMKPTQKTYKAHAPERDWPSSSRFADHGGFAALKREANRKVAGG